MSKNNNFDSNSELDEYLSKEITQYYGEDVISDIEKSSVPIPPKRSRNSRIISALGIICSVIFLTCGIIFSGVFLTSGISSADSDLSSNAFHAVESDTNEYFTDTDNLTTDNTSSNYAVESDTFSSGTTSESFTDTDTLESDTDIFSSEHNSDTDTAFPEQRTDYFSLPEYPDEGNISEIETDTNNNSSTNPNDNVTTGKKFRSNIGIILMTLLLITAYALYQMRAASSEKDKKTK